MTITYNEVVQYFTTNERTWRELAIAIEQAIVTARDTEGVPIYLTKARIKRPASAYLKTKRKAKKSVDQITDWIGVRVLCLFRQDIAPVHRFLLKLFFEPPAGIGEASITEIIVFNWEVAQAKRDIEDALSDYLQQSNIKFAADSISEHERHFICATKGTPRKLAYKTERRGSGYKSVHYSIQIGNVTVEVQLRTLLQDVWGELEHALSYKKGKIHPHIRSSFELLSSELEAKDMLVSGLRDESEKEKAFSLYGSIKSGPTKWIEYEPSFLKALPGDTEFQKFLSDYCSNFTPDKNNRWTRNSAWCAKMTELLAKGKEIASAQRTPHVEYFFDIEEAFVDFCKGDIAGAEKIYRRYTDLNHPYHGRWVVHFRLGEIHNVRGDTQEALVCFDRCESLLEHVDQSDRDPVVEFFAKQKLANVYWSLGEEYIETAVQKIEEAEKLFENVKGGPQAVRVNVLSLLNNLCYYTLERYLKFRSGHTVEQKFRATVDAERRFENLKVYVKDNPTVTVTSNVYDTLAWYAFQQYQASSDVHDGSPRLSRDWLTKAYAYVEAAEGKPNLASSATLTSVAIQHEHVQEIMTAYENKIRGASR